MKFIELCKEFYGQQKCLDSFESKYDFKLKIKVPISEKINFSGTYQNSSEIFSNNQNGEVLGYIHNGTECVGILKTKRTKKCFYMINLCDRGLLSGYGLKCVGIDNDTCLKYLNKIKSFKIKGNIEELQKQLDELLVLKNI